MLRIYARLLAGVLALIGIAALASILGVGLGAGILYLNSAAIVAYVSFPQRDPAIVRIVVGGMGVLFLLSGLFLALTMSVLGFPYEGRGWGGWPRARSPGRLDDGVRGVVALR